MQQLKHARARDNLTSCIRSRNDFPPLYLLRGLANGQLNQFADAEEDFRQALALPHDQQAEYGIHVNRGVLCLRQAQLLEGIAPVPWPFPGLANLTPVCWRVAQWQRPNKLAEAEAHLRKAIALQKDQYPAYRYLALVAQQQRSDEAVKLLRQAIDAAQNRERPVRAQLYGQRARLHHERQELTLALRDIDQACQLGSSWEDHAERGRILQTSRAYPEALEAYESALGLRPSEAALYRRKAEVLLALQKEAEAATALDQYLRNGGRPTAEVYRSRGQVLARLRRFPEALADYTEALNLRPDPATYTARGWILLANEVTPLALKDFEQAIRLDSKSAEAYTGRGLIRARQGQPTQALEDVESALSLARPGRDLPRLLWNAAHVYAQLAGPNTFGPAATNAWASRMRDHCQDQAVQVLRKALECVPAAERQAFWKRYVAQDALLNPIRGTPGFARLEKAYGK